MFKYNIYQHVGWWHISKNLSQHNVWIQIYCNVINFNLSSSFFLDFTAAPFAIFWYRSYVKGGWIQRPYKPFTQDIVVNVSPYLYLFPIFIVSFSKVNPCDLWIIKPQVSFNGSCFVVPLWIGIMGTTQRNTSSHGIPT